MRGGDLRKVAPKVGGQLLNTAIADGVCDATF